MRFFAMSNDDDSTNDDDLKNFAQLVWGKRSEGLPVPELNLERDITPQELENLKLHYAFVQIMNPQDVTDHGTIRFIRSNSGWLILDYGNAMTASPGGSLFDHGTYEKDEKGELKRICSGKGTITKQIIDTAADMVKLAKEDCKWPLLHLVDGERLFRFGIWKATKDLGIKITGYVASKGDEARYNRIVNQCPKTLVIQSDVKGIKP